MNNENKLNCLTALIKFVDSLNIIEPKIFLSYCKNNIKSYHPLSIKNFIKKPEIKLKNDIEYFYERGNKIGYKDLKNGFNPYKYAYIVSALIEFIFIYKFPGELKKIPVLKRQFVTLIIIYICMLWR